MFCSVGSAEFLLRTPPTTTSHRHRNYHPVVAHRQVRALAPHGGARNDARRALCVVCLHNIPVLTCRIHCFRVCECVCVCGLLLHTLSLSLTSLPLLVSFCCSVIPDLCLVAESLLLSAYFASASPLPVYSCEYNRRQAVLSVIGIH